MVGRSSVSHKRKEIVTHWGGNQWQGAMGSNCWWRKRFRTLGVLLNSQTLTTVSLDGSMGDTFFDVDYPIPSGIRDSILTVKFVAHSDYIAGGFTM